MKTEILNRYVRGVASDRERKAVHRWASESQENEDTLNALRDIYVAVLMKEDCGEIINVDPRRRTSRWKAAVGAVAAAACIACASILGIALKRAADPVPANPILINTIVSPQGKQTEYVMADGTRVSLNAGSSLDVYECSDKRFVRLHGEAFFDVTPNDKLPFIVETDQIDVKVFGTAFDVNAYGDDPSVVLVTGCVKVSDRSGEWTTIAPGQKYTYDTLTGRREVTNVEADNYVSWVEGYLRFSPATLEFVFGQLQNYFSTPIMYKSDALSKTLISGKLELRGGLDMALNNLKDLVPMKWTKSDNNTITITFINTKS